MQLSEPLVFVQFVLESHTWLSSLHCERNLFAKGNYGEKQMLTSLLDNKAIICDEQLFSFFSTLI